MPRASGLKRFQPIYGHMQCEWWMRWTTSHPTCMSDNKWCSSMELFANIRVASNPKHWQHFGCPTYVLDANLQSGKPFHKWMQWSRLHIYLGWSTQHARSVALVLNVHTGLMSPQFHIEANMAFDTISQIYKGNTKHMFLWQLKFLNKQQNFKIKRGKTIEDCASTNSKTYLSHQRESHHQSRRLLRLRMILYLDFLKMNCHLTRSTWCMCRHASIFVAKHEVPGHVWWAK